ncbi:MAG: OmpA family protein [Candidatus Kapaibacterium sp.]
MKSSGILIVLSLITITLSSNVGFAQERMPGRTIDRYTLILFNFDSPDAGALNDSILRTYVYNSIDSGAQIKITGYSDIIGLEDRNQQLSQDRAATIYEGIQLNVADSTIASIETEGVGETQPLYPNDLPEGRFYNRTVQIVVETPFKGE